MAWSLCDGSRPDTVGGKLGHNKSDFAGWVSASRLKALFA
jgi:hypothetical protein